MGFGALLLLLLALEHLLEELELCVREGEEEGEGGEEGEVRAWHGAVLLMMNSLSLWIWRRLEKGNRCL